MNNLVLLHGALGAAAQLNELKQQLEHKCTVFVYEFPGHGSRVGEKVKFDLSELCNDFHQWLNVNFTQQVDIFGYSMGGYASLYLAIHHSYLFRHIVTLGTKLDWNKESSVKEAAKLNPDTLLEKAPAYCEYLKSLHGDEWSNVLLKTSDLMLLLGEKPLLNTNNVASIRTKVTMMLGDSDKMVSREETLAIQQSISDSGFVSMVDTIHPIERIDTAKLAQQLLQLF